MFYGMNSVSVSGSDNDNGSESDWGMDGQIEGCRKGGSGGGNDADGSSPVLRLESPLVALLNQSCMQLQSAVCICGLQYCALVFTSQGQDQGQG
jgi:hypothetical protein